ncbi:hypothetical protein GCM10018773_24840 [Streptomyces candidus]|nr:hypothetical protein GCM10018773_24840 [Streptomyces candidus]
MQVQMSLGEQGEITYTRGGTPGKDGHPRILPYAGRARNPLFPNGCTPERRNGPPAVGPGTVSTCPEEAHRTPHRDAAGTQELVARLREELLEP